jgi:hypothetical protein
MGGLLGFFAGGPARIQALLVGVLAMALVCAGLTIWALWERAGRLSLRAELTAAVDQGKVLADKLLQCDTATAATKSAGDRSVAEMRRLVAAVDKRFADTPERIRRLEDLLKLPPPAGATCEDAWRAIEAARGQQ